jgi:hypothetical protein
MITPNDKVLMPALEHPDFKTAMAIENGCDKKWLIKTWGGLGDVVCAEPTIRFIDSHLPDIHVTIKTAHPEIFRHLKVTRVPLETSLDETQYYTVNTINHQDSLAWKFMSHGICHPVDYVSLNILRGQLPTADREIKLPRYTSMRIDPFAYLVESPEDFIVVHPGKHWPSKTFPADWWAELTHELSKHWAVILIGKTVDENVGYVPFSIGLHSGIYDLRDYPGFGLKDLIAFLTHAEYVFTNDSAPIHIAAAGKAHIGFIASCKHADFLFHWRGNKWKRRMYDFGRDNLYYHLNKSPVQGKSVEYGDITPEQMNKILPNPKDVVKGMLTLRPKKRSTLDHAIFAARESMRD